ncbi:104aa long hypothetical protein [Pyrococcus horikoshii OT3]|uniref:Uncharacterized protein n=1 Tax=Pyrococcus horikoshii (strain ATCC 700860 / DSM 12428 / JCM 9974 / NBRC 100139 / OT-3) TaxID=70601 RepID=O57995_PYRHO|nr:104aa long hypothetical protein [Pyrococcus horikoshii OT3]
MLIIFLFLITVRVISSLGLVLFINSMNSSRVSIFIPFIPIITSPFCSTLYAGLSFIVPAISTPWGSNASAIPLTRSKDIRATTKFAKLPAPKTLSLLLRGAFLS